LGSGAVVAALVATTACNTAKSDDTAEQPKVGGTLIIYLSRAPINHLDPAQISITTDANISRLTSRTLTTYKAEPGSAGSEIVGDLATDTGRPSENNTVWDFTLKSGLKWEDGTPIICDQVKYGVERTYASDIFTDGLKYPQQYLKDNATPYRGPFKAGDNGGKGLESIQCLDNKTIRFKLQHPVGDFGYTVTTNGFSPVPREADAGDKTKYDTHPLSNGPYKIASWGGGEKDIVFVRNPNWSRENDSVRKAYPDKIIVRTNTEADEVTDKMINSRGEDAYAINIDADVAPTFIQQVINDPTLDARAIKGEFSGVRYMAINTKNVKDPACRQAYEYAFNRRKFRAALGGSTQGKLATSMLSPLLTSYKNFDLYGTNANPDGDPDKAKALLKEATDAGSPCPGTLGSDRPTVKLAYPNTVLNKRAMSTVVEAMALAGVDVELQPQDPATYYGGPISETPNDFDMIYGGWIADWNNGSAVLPPLFDGRQIVAEGNINFSQLNDPEVNQMIDDAISETNFTRQNALWGELDNKIQELGAAIPIIYTSATRMAGTKVRGAYISPAFGQPDVVSLGLADGSSTPS
jgi:peptide/nickel transport system substrate-binding protein